MKESYTRVPQGAHRGPHHPPSVTMAQTAMHRAAAAGDLAALKRELASNPAHIEAKVCIPPASPIQKRAAACGNEH